MTHKLVSIRSDPHHNGADRSFRFRQNMPCESWVTGHLLRGVRAAAFPIHWMQIAFAQSYV
ncbi:hypothetical protein [Acidovorax sp. LjRoot117]|uniref:hypothetical protein n=1 Tax=Acidovorax sp. LjRoot117 TaxID=3342255 RepID=UPI003ECE17D9